MEKLNIYEALATVLTMDYAVGKDEKNQQQGYRYRGIEKTVNAVKPLLAKVGVFYVPEVLDVNREERAGRNGGTLIYSIMRVRYTFFASDGSSVSATVVGEGMDSGDKASNKAMSAALKYALGNVLNIPTEMVDSETDSPEPAPQSAAKKPVDVKQESTLAREPEREEADDAEAAAENAAIETARVIIQGVVDAETATKAIPAMQAIKHAGGSQKKVGAMFNRHAKELGLTYDAEARKYVPAAAEAENNDG